MEVGLRRWSLGSIGVDYSLVVLYYRFMTTGGKVSMEEMVRHLADGFYTSWDWDRVYKALLPGSRLKVGDGVRQAS